MAGALSLLLTVCLLPGVFSALFQIFMPEKIEAVAGTCVTIPCSFEIESSYQSQLDRTCLAIWKRNGRSDTQTVTSRFQTTPTTTELKNKTCTSTLINTQMVDNGTYYFRLECQTNLKYNYLKGVEIQVKDDPTLSPSVLDVVEGASVSLQCSAPAPCPPLHPTVTWTPSLGTSQETLRNNTDKTEVLISVMKFTASHLHHGQTFYCTASYKKQDKSSVSVISSPSKADIQFAPQILSSSHCVQAASTVSCSCWTVGNPPPRLQWRLDGLPVNHSDNTNISIESVNGTGQRSTITVNLLQGLDLSTLLCHSSNSVGSVKRQFHVFTFEDQTTPCQGWGILIASVSTVAILLLFVCVMLFILRTRKTRPMFSSPLSMKPLPGGNDEVNSAREMDVYTNTDTPRQGHESTLVSPRNTSLLDNAQAYGQRSAENKQEGTEVIYSSVLWKSKKKEEGSVDLEPSCSFYLEEEKCMKGDVCKDDVSNAVGIGNQYDDREPKHVKREVDCEYAQIIYKVKSANE